VSAGTADARRVQAPLLTLKVAPAEFSPNGDGLRDAVRATITVDEAVTLAIQIVSDKGLVVYSNDPGVVAEPGEVSFRWNGKASGKPAGPALRDGRYTVVVAAVDQAAAETDAQADVLLDTHPPALFWRSAPSVLRAEPLKVGVRAYDLTANLRLKLALVDQTGTVIPISGAYSRPPGKLTLVWPKSRVLRLVPEAYQLSVEATDAAGNAAQTTERRFLLDHPVRAHVYARFDGVGRHVALTFDDCNSAPAWRSILRTLARFKLKGTFFCPGKQVLANPELARRTVREGHAIGSHGWDHARFASLSYASALQRLLDDRDVWWKLARVAPTPYFRPPYGAYTSSTLAAAGRAGYGAIVLWDVDPQDWRQPGSDATERRILAHVKPGSIVLMHVLPQTAAMLPSLIGRLATRHLLPVTLPELDRLGTPTAGGWHATGSG
jgi:peptidoglycan/xylan/chitin deacetylase (PgdA/CDA1 family)